MDENLDNQNFKKRTKKINYKKYACFFLIAFVLFHLGFFSSQYKEHMNGVYPQARKYFIANNLVFLHKKFFNIFVDADSKLMQPLDKLQTYLYDKGIQHIPENDGERAFWNYKFNLYPYINKAYMPQIKNTNPFEPSLIHIEILDNIYKTIIELDSYGFKDKTLKNEKFKVVPLLADQFSAYYYLYAGTSDRMVKKLSSIALNKKDVREKVLKILSILNKYDKTIRNDKELEISLMKASDSILYSLYTAEQYLALELTYADIELGNFKCDAEYTKIYLDTLDYAYSGENPFLEKKVYKSSQNITDIMFCNNYATKTVLYTLNDKCGIKIEKCYPTQEYIDKNHF